MANKPISPSKSSAFDALGFSKTIELAKQEIKELYLSDQVPWVIGYSGGKDSSAVLQLAWLAIQDLPPEQRVKPVHVISTDTLVENPVVASWVNRSLIAMADAAAQQASPVQPHRLTPEASDTFWVNLIGRGYPAPRNKFRWCTERMKIKPSNTFIRNVVKENGEAILLLGTRKGESSRRAANMAKHQKNAIRDRLTPNASLTNCLIYTPIEDWTNDDVWLFLMREKNPWGYSNKDLLTMYRGATEDGECPLVVDTSTPSCGNSRFGCWVCTLVDEDKSMGAMIQNDEEKQWMQPLLMLRNELDFRSDAARATERGRRDFRRITGKLTYYAGAAEDAKLVHGPYKQAARAHWLKRVLQTQQWIRENGPEYVREIELITLEELQEIRRIWVVDKHEIEDLLPRLYEEAVGTSYPGPRIDDNLIFDGDTLELLREACGDDPDGLLFEMSRNLLDLERRYRSMASRRGLFEALSKTIERCFYDDENDALSRAREIHELRTATFVSDDGHEVSEDGHASIHPGPTSNPQRSLFEENPFENEEPQ